tara:strand:- start:717 stop:1610 length:894 start_codon:yes stop_codon:yes gene_type:complete
MNKQDVTGIILIITCKKYIYSRVVQNKYKLTGESIGNWKIIYVISEPNMNDNYKLSYVENGLNSNLLILKGRDDYIHLFEKVVKAQDVCLKLFNIKEGIIKCDDDILINKSKFLEFLNNPNKGEYRGRNYKNISFPNPGPEHCKENRPDNEIRNYYTRNPKELEELKRDIPTFNHLKYNVVPKLPEGASGCGGVYYLSNNASTAIVNYFKKCNFDVFYYEPISRSYPFIAEDTGTSFITCYSGIVYTCDENMFSHSWHEINKNALGFHTHLHGSAFQVKPEIYKILNGEDHERFKLF